MRIVRTIFLIMLGVAIIAVIISYSGISWAGLIHSLSSIRGYYLAGLLLLTTGLVYMASRRWELLVNSISGNRVKITRSYYFYYSAISFLSSNVVPHLGNFGAKSLSMKLVQKMPFATATLIVLVEQLFDLFILCIVILPSVFYLAHIMTLSYAVITLGALLVGALTLFALFGGVFLRQMLQWYVSLVEIVSRIPFFGKRLSVENIKVDHVDNIDRYSIVRLYMYSAIKFFITVARYYTVAVAINMPLSFPAAIIATPAAMVIILMGSMPASIGTHEAGWFGTLMLLGMSKDTIGLFVITTRILGEFSMILVAAVAYPAYIAQRARAKKCTPSADCHITNVINKKGGFDASET